MIGQLGSSRAGGFISGADNNTVQPRQSILSDGNVITLSAIRQSRRTNRLALLSFGEKKNKKILIRFFFFFFARAEREDVRTLSQKVKWEGFVASVKVTELFNTVESAGGLMILMTVLWKKS